jgi:hypothetical protein
VDGWYCLAVPIRLARKVFSPLWLMEWEAIKLEAWQVVLQ